MKQLSKIERDVIVYALRYAYVRETGVIIEVGEFFLNNIKSFEEWELIHLISEMKIELGFSLDMPRVCKNQIEFILIRISEELHERKENINESTT
jgi:hypothetical protein